MYRYKGESSLQGECSLQEKDSTFQGGIILVGGIYPHRRGFTPTGGDLFLQEGIYPYRGGIMFTGEGYSYRGGHPSGGVILTGGAYNPTMGGFILTRGGFIRTWGDSSLQQGDLTFQGGSSQQKQLPIQGGDLHLQVGVILTGGI